MNEEQYRLVCEACDRALLAPDSTIERIAIQWLHVIREHPALLGNYVDLFEPTKGVKAVSRQWLRDLRSKVATFRQLGRAFGLDGRPWVEPKELPEQVDVLLVSHFLNASHAGQVDDFYYGKLPVELSAQGYTAVIALINYSDMPGTALVEKWKPSSVSRVILTESLGFAEEVNLHCRLRRESSRLRRLAKKEADGLHRKVLLRASQEAMWGGARGALRIAEQIGALVSKLKPKVIVVTHEGHAWERTVFAAARSAFPEVRCIGYQHAALFRLQHAIRRNLSREYNPDNILAAGSVTKANLERAPGLEGIPISVLGSNRSFKRATNNGSCVAVQKNVGHLNSPACLVLPEGIESECHLLFEFSLACARVCPEIQFIWRLHPLVIFESLAEQNPKLWNLPKNIVLSKAILEEDIGRSTWTLYRGTTTVVQTVVAGLRPVYLQLPDEMTVDPLYELKVWRMKVTNVTEFQKAIRPDVNVGDNPQESALELARKYCESCFLPSDVGALTVLLPKKN